MWKSSILNTFSQDETKVILNFCNSLELKCLCHLKKANNSSFCELCSNILRAIKYDESEIIISKNERISVKNVMKYNAFIEKQR